MCRIKISGTAIAIQKNICNIENIIVYLYFVYHHNLQYYNFEAKEKKMTFLMIHVFLKLN